MTAIHKDSDQPSQAVQLIKMTWPMLFGVLSLMSFQLVDSIFIGQLGVEPLAALGFTIPMYQGVIGIQVGLGIATTAVISQTLGRGNTEDAARLGGVVLMIGAALIALLCLLLWAFRHPIVIALGADSSLLPVIDRFWIPWLCSAWVGAMLYFGYSLCRAHGNTLLPGMVMVATSLINIALDPVFIFVLDFGLPGAALATLCSFLLGAMVVYPKLLRRHWFSFRFAGFSVRHAAARLGQIMGPAMISQLLPAISATLATALVAGFGASAVAAWGLGTRMEFFSIVVVLALTMSMPPMVGRYLGAGEIDKIRSLVKTAVGFVLLWQLAIALLWLATSGPVSDLFADDDSVSAILKDYLLRVPLSYGALGTCMIMVSVCNAMGLPMRALTISCLRLFACYLPFLWLGAMLADIEGLLTGALLGNLGAGIMSWLLYRKGLQHLRDQTPEKSTDQGGQHAIPSHHGAHKRY
ncbi:MAG: MATE family efflux transporter [Ketobacteraceae bacterium]|nr:MATE family efflux transporter [Ketobacteraceae bacterium]